MESHDSGGDKADYWDGPLPRSLVLGQLPWFFLENRKLHVEGKQLENIISFGMNFVCFYV